MLPFTKRPGRGDESGDLDVVTKDDGAMAETINPKAKGSSAPVRAKFSSLSDEEMTNIIPSKAIGEALESARSSPRPAAGMPPSPSSGRTAQRTVPPSRTSSTSASRSGKFAAMDDEEEDGRTVVRGAPKIVKRTNAPNSKMGMPTSPTTISPAAVIKATLESARAGQNKRTGEHLMAPPPKDLLEDLSDLQPHPADGPGSEHTKILLTTGSGAVVALPGAQTLPLQAQSMSHGSIPPGSARPMSAAPPAMVGHTTNASGGYPAQQSGGYAAQSGGYPSQQSGGYPAQYNGPVPSGSVSAPGVSMPAHFMVPQAPYSDGRMDPPATAVTARTKVAGRPAMSWAMALMSFGLFVGVGAFAVMSGNADGFMETSAAFVDPARAGAGAPKAVAVAAAAPVAPVAAPVPNDQPAGVGAAAVVAPAAPVAPVAAPVVAAATAVAGAVAPVAPAVTAAPAAPVVTAPPAVVAVAPTAKPVHTSAPVIHRPAPAPEPVAAAPTAKPPTGRGPKPPTAGTKPAGDPGLEEEQRKALKALQDSQLESTF